MTFKNKNAYKFIKPEKQQTKKSRPQRAALSFVAVS